ncbi:hypothetical protein BSKO_00559 [Bryopsis sp. KO-2023]|nr:hypothetical protein BSKO_00559 [Bryopsis sp. KO-2023]
MLCIPQVERKWRIFGKVKSFCNECQGDLLLSRAATLACIALKCRPQRAKISDFINAAQHTLVNLKEVDRQQTKYLMTLKEWFFSPCFNFFNTVELQWSATHQPMG